MAYFAREEAGPVERAEWQVIGRLYSTAGGKTVHVRHRVRQAAGRDRHPDVGCAGFSVLSLGIANDAKVLALLANFASRSLRRSALEYSRMLLTGTQLGHNSNSARF